MILQWCGLVRASWLLANRLISRSARVDFGVAHRWVSNVAFAAVLQLRQTKNFALPNASFPCPKLPCPEWWDVGQPRYAHSKPVPGQGALVRWEVRPKLVSVVCVLVCKTLPCFGVVYNSPGVVRSFLHALTCSGGSSSSTVSFIVLGVLAGLIVVALLLALLMYCLRKRRQSHRVRINSGLENGASPQLSGLSGMLLALRFFPLGSDLHCCLCYIS